MQRARPSDSRQIASVADRRLEVETPEHVVLSYSLAGPGSRFAASLVDGIILFVGLPAAFVGIVFGMSLFLPRVLAVIASPVSAGLLILLAFATIWGYFIYFEGFRDGQTPGKRALGLRVVHDGGHALTLRGAAIRNLVRLIDIQPIPSGLVGGAMILLHPRAQRLGDLAAATIVVRERVVSGLAIEPRAAGPTELGRPQLSEREYEVLSGYAGRRSTLERNARDRLALQLAPHFASRFEDVAQVPRGRQVTDADRVDAALTRLHAQESGRRSTAGVPGASGSPAAAGLVRRQAARWAEYGALVLRAKGRGLTNLAEADVSRFAALYRETASDLARARTYGASSDILYTLERAVAGGHNLLYTRARQSRQAAAGWLIAGFPRMVRRRKAPILLAALFLFGPALISSGAIVIDPGRASEILPAQMIAHAEEGVAREAAGVGYADVPNLAMPIFSSAIIANNVQVSFVAFAGGILAGLGTAIVLIFNGIHLGGVVGLFQAEGLSLYLWSFVLPHGVIELTAICIAGGAGLWLGSAFLLPGRRTRRAALADRARDAIALVGGAVILLVAAGLIEGFISPAQIPFPIKATVSALTALGLFPYLALAGRRDEEEANAGPEIKAGPGA